MVSKVQEIRPAWAGTELSQLGLGHQRGRGDSERSSPGWLVPAAQMTVRHGITRTAAWMGPSTGTLLDSREVRPKGRSKA